MEILTVGEKQDHRLYIVKINDVRFLIGCGADLEQLLSYLPEGMEIHSDENRAGQKGKKDLSKSASNMVKTIDTIKYLTGEAKFDLSLYASIDIASIDYILITRLDNIFALPVLTEGLRFEGTVIMTQPIQQIGYEMLKEFAEINEQRRQRAKAIESGTLEKIEDLPFVDKIWEEAEVLDQLEKEGKFVSEWGACFRQEELDNCWSKVQVVNLKEEVSVRGGVKLSATASGYHIGSACFSLSYGSDKLLIIDGHSYHRYRHCLPFDYKVLRDHTKILLTDSFYSSEEVKPKVETESRLTQAELCVNRLIGILKKLLKEHKGEHVLMPVRNTLCLLDIIEVIREKLPGFRKIHVFSSTAEPILKYSNANVDYLNKTLQAKIFQAKPELPFNTDRYAEEKKIQFFSDIHEFVELIKHKPYYLTDNIPSLFISVDSTLRLGYSGKLFDTFNNEVGGGSILFTDPFLCHSNVFEPLYHQNKLRLVNFPLNLHDSLVSTVNLIKKDTPDCKIIVPEKYHKLLKASPLGERVIPLNNNSSVEFDLTGKEGVYIKPQNFSNLKPKNLESVLPYKLERSDLFIETFQGQLYDNGGKTTLNIQEMRREETPAVLAIDRSKKYNDQLILEKMYELAKKLQENGFQIMNVEKRMDDSSVYILKCGSSTIRHSPTTTEIFTDSDQEYKTILKCLKTVLGVCAL